MSLTIARGWGKGGRRESEPLKVRVSEPPVAGRPLGYAIGDVGRFELSAEVAPREIEQDDALGVTVNLAGTGNLPSTLPLPQRQGVEWLEPQLREKLGAVRGEKFGGTRTFSYVVRVHKAGDVDLGELTLPFWDADAGKYGVARVPLGPVRVKAVARAQAQNAASPNDPLQGLPAPCAKREGAPAARAHLADSHLFWLGLAATPLAFGVVMAGRAARKRIAAIKTRAPSPKAEMKERIAAAAAACAGEDGRKGDAEIVRALEAASLAMLGVNLRGETSDRVAAQLADAGVDEVVARRAQEIYRASEGARFSPEAPELGAVRERWRAAREIIGSLSKNGGAP
jgi:hypothetical protein